MVLHLFFQITLILIFTSELSVNGCLEVRQPQELLLGKENQSVFISCHINTTVCGGGTPEVLWYVFTSDSHHQLDVKKQPDKYQLKSQQLQINYFTNSDDGVYYCAATLNGFNKAGAQAFGSGTTVKVTEQGNYRGRTMLLAFLILLTLLSITVLTYIICIKTGQHTAFLKRRFRRSDGKIDSSKRVHFGAVVQELYSKRNLRKKNASGEVTPENKFENPRSQTVKEDIYQNLKRTG